MATLPNADRARLDVQKLVSYLLDPGHPVGRHKAAVFRAALGFTRSNATEFAALISRGVRTAQASVALTDRYGTRYIVDMEIVGPTGTAIVRTGWIIDHGETEPRFVTAYVR
jgi:filamentous hemagglutinin